MLWLACIAVVAAAGFFTLRPLFRDPEGTLDVDLLAETELDRLLDRKSVIYKNLTDLQFEYKMGRLSDPDFDQLQSGYKNEAAVLLERLDQLNAADNLDEVIEKEIASRKHKLYGAAAAKQQTKRAAHCPSCGAELIAGKKFCADCGHRLI